MPKKRMTAQKIYDTILREYEEIEMKDPQWVVYPAYDAGRMFAYSHVLQLLLQLEEVEYERGEAEN